MKVVKIEYSCDPFFNHKFKRSISEFMHRLSWKIFESVSGSNSLIALNIKCVELEKIMIKHLQTNPSISYELFLIIENHLKDENN